MTNHDKLGHVSVTSAVMLPIFRRKGHCHVLTTLYMSEMDPLLTGILIYSGHHSLFYLSSNRCGIRWKWLI